MAEAVNIAAQPAGLGASLQTNREGDSLVVILSGEWKLSNAHPSAGLVEREMDAAPKPARLRFETQALSGWDSSLLTFLLQVSVLCARKGLEVSQTGLPPGVQRLLALATAVPEKKEARRTVERQSFLFGLGEAAAGWWRAALLTLDFLGELAASFLRLLTGKAPFRFSDFLLYVEESGAQALPIVSLISLLVGLILAFIGAIQLKMFGAQIYVANLVGIAMVRAMGAVMAGVIMAGRTGASYAAQIGTMQVNEEVDALKTSGISPMDFLVLPRVLALALMMPLLTLYADLLGMVGGLIVGVAGLDLGVRQYYNATVESVGLTTVAIGVFSGLTFGVLIALCGCLKGMQCGRSASAVGDATRSAVVSGIVCIVVAMTIITVSCNILGI